MAIRPYWSGTIRVSLVSLSVDMFTALDAGQKIAFHQIYKPTGERVRQKLVAGEVEVERADIVKGYEVEKGEYILFEPDEIKDLKIASSKAMELVRFVPYDAVDAIYFDTPYYLAPSGKGDLATFSVIRDSMRELKVMGIGQIVISGSERLCAIKPCGPGLLLETLHYADEIKKSGYVFGDIKTVSVDGDEKDLAKQLIKRKVGDFEPEEFHDRYSDALRELVDSRIENREPVIPEERPAAKVVNLMDALRASLKEPSGSAANDSAEAAKPKASPKAKAKAAPARKAG
ncbi:non-homologous end joining protein Ku [Asticcacaulis taihuensis]|uniref:Non-homologous end joining protein Ku n=1 Tax=Asticcacaulis taihuensis TaxID=260084 RepID=A0A1G4PWE0_9CAUL|nr:Ku protein [Asticcacaulis taihuensis]SCW36602.1 DNA end-binding protein Ku [Asticcacaulis taihuensis]